MQRQTEETHTHTQNSVTPHPVARSWPTATPLRALWKKEITKGTTVPTDTLLLSSSRFLFLLFSLHQNIEGFENDNYQEGGV